MTRSREVVTIEESRLARWLVASSAAVLVVAAVVLATPSATKYSVLDGGLVAWYAVGYWLAVTLLVSAAIVATVVALGGWAWRLALRTKLAAPVPKPASGCGPLCTCQPVCKCAA